MYAFVLLTEMLFLASQIDIVFKITCEMKKLLNNIAVVHPILGCLAR